MNAFETYQHYLGLKLHFESEKYDYFKYGARTKASIETLEGRPDKRFFISTSQLRDPLEFMVGNFIFNDDKWIGSFEETYRRKYRKFIKNGEYVFLEDIKKLHPILKKNLEYENIPPIAYLFLREEISFYTLCVFEHALNLSTKWYTSPSIILFKSLTQKINKSHKFFPIEKDKYKRIIIDHFKL